jgi:hypothetical protein
LDAQAGAHAASAAALIGRIRASIIQYMVALNQFSEANADGLNEHE